MCRAAIAALCLGIVALGAGPRYQNASNAGLPISNPLTLDDQRLSPDSARLILSHATLGQADSTAVLDLSLQNLVPIAGLWADLSYDRTLRLDTVVAIGRGLGQSGFGYYEFAAGRAYLIVFDLNGAELAAESSSVAQLHFRAAGSPDTGCTYRVDFGETEVATAGPQLITHQAADGHINQPFLRGDVWVDGFHDVFDIIFLIDYAFSGGPSPCPVEAGDVDLCGVPGDPIIDVFDIVYMIDYVFSGGPAPCN